jgi:hypothetical protein
MIADTVTVMDLPANFSWMIADTVTVMDLSANFSSMIADTVTVMNLSAAVIVSLTQLLSIGHGGGDGPVSELLLSDVGVTSG